MHGISIRLFATALVVLIVTDMIWLGFVAKNMYLEQYQPWLRLTNGQLRPVWWAALVVYLMFALGILVFVLPLSNTAVIQAAFYGAILGAVIYGVYDFTCISIFRDFPLVMGCIDWLWGTFLIGWTSAITAFVAGYLK